MEAARPSHDDKWFAIGIERKSGCAGEREALASEFQSVPCRGCLSRSAATTNHPYLVVASDLSYLILLSIRIYVLPSQLSIPHRCFCRSPQFLTSLRDFLAKSIEAQTV